MTIYTNIIFDLDGTITDPGSGITNSIMYALDRFSIKAERSALFKFIGPPLRESFRKYFGFDETRAEQAVVYYREYFSDKGIYENDLYYGIPELLDILKKQKKNLFVATSKPSEYSVRILEYFGIDKYFDFVSGSNMDGSMSDKKDLIKRILVYTGKADLTGTVMVGDRKYDIEGAKYHGLDSVAVTYGYGEISELEKSEPTCIVESIGELRHFLLKD